MIELADYLVQLSAAAAGFCAALRRYLRCRRQPWFLLACFYGTFALGTLYWTLHLLLRQETPQIFYVSDLAWTASFVFTNGSILHADGGSVSGTVKNGYQNYSDPGTITGGSCTRAQIVTFLWRAAGCPEPKSGVGSAAFPDVPADSYYAKAVA